MEGKQGAGGAGGVVVRKARRSAEVEMGVGFFQKPAVDRARQIPIEEDRREGEREGKGGFEERKVCRAKARLLCQEIIISSNYLIKGSECTKTQEKCTFGL